MPKKPEPEKKQCSGGRSFGCNRTEHDIGKVEDVFCFRCKTRMGCSRCVEPAGSRVCLNCHDWATRAALGRHGPMVSREKGAEAMKIVMMIAGRKITESDGNKLLDELFAMA